MPPTLQPEIFTPETFMALYRNYMETGEFESSDEEKSPQAYAQINANWKEDNGYYIPQNILSVQDTTQGFNATTQMFTELYHSENKSYWDTLIASPHGKARLGRMMQLGTHAMISLGATLKTLQHISSQSEINKHFNTELTQQLASSRLSGACKQDIDRAIVENIALRLYFRMISHPDEHHLSPNEVQEIVGGVIGRAYLVEGRLIQWKRYVILSDLLHFVNDAKGMGIVQQHISNYKIFIITEK